MKRFILSLAALGFLTIGCKDRVGDEPKVTGTFEQRITGTWNLTDVDYQGAMPNPLNPSQDIAFTGEGEDTYGSFQFNGDGTAQYEMGFTARLDIGTNEPVRLPFYRPGAGNWWTKNDSVFVAEAQDTAGYKVVEDTDDKQRWRTVLPILDSVSNTFVDVDLEVILRR